MSNGADDFALDSFNDTGLWKLFISIAPTGMAGILKRADSPERPPILLFRKSWEDNGSDFLHHIESTVYDNPRILDDFATRIIITAPKSLWIPAEMAEEDDYDEKYFTSIYPAESEDIFADFLDDKICLYTSAPGLKSFLNRTLPGCRIQSHISMLESSLGNNSSDLPVINVNIRQGEADILAYNQSHLISSSTQLWREIPDLAYRIFLLADAYGWPRHTLEINIIGSPEYSMALKEYLDQFVKNISIAEIPESMTELGIPYTLAIAE